MKREPLDTLRGSDIPRRSATTPARPATRPDPAQLFLRRLRLASHLAASKSPAGNPEAVFFQGGGTKPPGGLIGCVQAAVPPRLRAFTPSSYTEPPPRSLTATFGVGACSRHSRFGSASGCTRRWLATVVIEVRSQWTKWRTLLRGVARLPRARRSLPVKPQTYAKRTSWVSRGAWSSVRGRQSAGSDGSVQEAGEQLPCAEPRPTSSPTHNTLQSAAAPQRPSPQTAWGLREPTQPTLTPRPPSPAAS